jgi:hypothetical protein
MRVYVYVDGFNLYYRALRKTPHKWLNLLALSQQLLDPDDSVEAIRYFTARVSSRSGDPDAPRRQQLYLSALSSIPILTCHYGRFLPKTKFRPLVSAPTTFVEIHDTEEKGSDVALASHLLNDGYLGRYDAALVMSQDTDLCEPLKMVRDNLRKPVGLVWLDGKQPGGRLVRAASFVRHVTPARLAASQFPDQVMGRNGHLVERPASWR